MAINTFFFLYVGLPFLAPVLLVNDYNRSANFIYWWYRVLCHLLPSRAYFIAGEQVCLCHRCIAIYGTIFLAGLLFSFVRHSLKPLSPRWYILFLLPMALDGGMGLTSELSRFVPMVILGMMASGIIGLVALVLYTQKKLAWQIMILLAGGVLGLAYLQFWGPHQSNLLLRNITGLCFGIGIVWVAYPLLEEGFKEMRQETGAKLAGE